jgi:hypothetical protein
MTYTYERPALDERQAQIETLIAKYPRISSEELNDVLFWLKHEATALEVGFLASDPALERKYRQLRSDHLDRLNRHDALHAAAVFGTVAAVAGGIVYLAAL